MSIIIPSKNIYEIDNQKIRNNVIDNVSVEQTVVAPNNEYEVAVYNEKIKKEITFNPRVQDDDTKYFSGNVLGTYYAFAYVDMQAGYIKNYTIKIPRQSSESKLINNLLLGVNKEDEANIKYTVNYTLNTYDLSADIQEKGTNIEISNIRRKSDEPIESERGSGQIPNTEYSHERFIVNAGTAKAEVKQTNETNLSSITIESKYFGEDLDNFYLDITLLVSITQRYYEYGSGITIATISEGKEYEYIPESVEITVYGDTLGIDLTDGSVTYGRGNKPHSLSGNELLQDSGKVGETPLSEHLAKNVLNQYANGKETAELLCDINDYYSSSGILAITQKNKVPEMDISKITFQKESEIRSIITVDTISDVDLKISYEQTVPEGLLQSTVILSAGQKSVSVATGSITRILKAEYVTKMAFKNGDTVIPYIFSANGKDKPMSTYKDGTPKAFEVVGSNIIYDGAVWQELTLLEKNQENA